MRNLRLYIARADCAGESGLPMVVDGEGRRPKCEPDVDVDGEQGGKKG